MVIWHLKQIGKVKKLRKWMPHELTHTHTQIIVLKCCLLLFFSTTMNHFSIGLWCVMKSGLYTTTGDDQLSGWTKKKLQSTFQGKTCTKKDHGHCLVVCCPSDQLQPSESRRNHYIWKVYSANQRDALKTATPAADIDPRNGPDSSPWQRLTTCRTTKASKVEWIGVPGGVSAPKCCAFIKRVIFKEVSGHWDLIKSEPGNRGLSAFVTIHEAMTRISSCPWDFPGKSTGVGCHCLLREQLSRYK